MDQHMQPRSLTEIALDAVSEHYVEKLNNASQLTDPERQTDIWDGFPPLNSYLSDKTYDKLREKTTNARQVKSA